MKFSVFGKLTAASLVAGAALGFASLPADAQTIPNRAAVVDTETNVVQAQYRGGRNYRRGDRHYRGGHRYGGRRGYRHSRRFSPGLSFGLGLGLGTVLPHLATPRAYAAPTPYASGRLVPGSAAWVQYCSQKYNSFDPSSGTYLAYSGVRRPCQVP